MQAIGDLPGNQNLKDRMAQIEKVIKRMDFRWDNGSFTDAVDNLSHRVPGEGGG